MHMDTLFFPGEEEQPELTISCDCWSHPGTVPDGAGCM